MAFQLVDDILGITGDPVITGKSSSSDVRAGKRSAPVVAALTSGTNAGRRLAALLADGPPESEEEVALATELDHRGRWPGLGSRARPTAGSGARWPRWTDCVAARRRVTRISSTLARYVVERDR